MIEQNLGNLERVVRLILGAALVAFAIMAPTLSLTEMFVGFIGLTLVLNGIFSRCYVWYIFDLNTAENSKPDRV
jgi:hypothetical protein